MGQPRSRWASSARNKARSAAPEHRAAPTGGQAPLTPTALTRDTCCALGVHSEGCGCGD